MAKAKETARDRAKRKWKDGLDTNTLKDRDSKKGDFYRAPGSRVSYINRGTIKMFVPRDGKNRIRVIQPLEIEELGFYGMEMHFHRSVGDEGEALFGDYLCNARMKPVLKACYSDLEMSGSCFICSQQTTELWDTDPELAKAFYPDRRIWFLVYDLLADDPEEILLWSCPWTLHEEIVSRSSDEETTVYIDVSHPIKGVPVSFEKSGKGKLTRYTNIQIFKTTMALSDSTLDQMIEFVDAINIPNPDVVKAAFLNVSAEEIESGSVEEAEGGQDDREEDSTAEPDGPPDCFQKEYDVYQDCEDCEYAADCAEPPKPKKPKKPEKPKRELRKPRKDTEPEANESDGDKKEAIRKKIREARDKNK